MQFKVEDLLTQEELITFIDSESPITKASILATKLKKFVLVTKEKDLFIYKENVTYENFSKDDNPDDELLNFISIYINKCYELSISSIRQRLDYDSKSKALKVMLANVSISKYMIQLKCLLRNDKLRMDDYKNEIHFENGFLNLNDGTFHKRQFGKHYISYVIPREYKFSDSKSREYLRKIFRKTYSAEEDYQNVMFELAKCLKGDPYEYTETLF